MDHQDSLHLLRKIAAFLKSALPRPARAARAMDADRDTCRESLARIGASR